LNIDKPLRGWIINDGTTVMNSLVVEKSGIICIGEDNIDDKSFNNEYIYNEDTRSYSLNASVPNQVSFTLKFRITTWGENASKMLVDLKNFFDQVGKEFIFTRNINNFPNTFVVDAIMASHISNQGEYIGFEVACSYVGEFKDYIAVRRKIIFNGDERLFEFEHEFVAPEPSTEFSKRVDDNFIENLNNDTGKSAGLIYTINPLEPIDSIKITNLTTNEVFKIDSEFDTPDQIILDTEADEPTFILNRNGALINLLLNVDFSVSTIPMLSLGDNLIRVDMTYRNLGKSKVDLIVEYWDKGR